MEEKVPSYVAAALLVDEYGPQTKQQLLHGLAETRAAYDGDLPFEPTKIVGVGEETVQPRANDATLDMAEPIFFGKDEHGRYVLTDAGEFILEREEERYGEQLESVRECLAEPPSIENRGTRSGE